MNSSEHAVLEETRRLGPWFHNLHLPGGIQTAPEHFLGDFPAFKWREIESSIPGDLSGWEVLDIGCNGGFYTFELAKRGARVTGIDIDERYLAQARWAAEHLDLQDRVSFRQMQVYDLARWGKTFDLVLFMGVFYHLRYPLLGLDAVTRCVKRRLVFQTMTMPGEEVARDIDGLGLNDRGRMLEEGWPKMAFIEGRLQNDPTNWWAASHGCVEAMLRTCGMKVISRPAHEVYICEKDANGTGFADGDGAAEFRAAAGLDSGSNGSAAS